MSRRAGRVAAWLYRAGASICTYVRDGADRSGYLRGKPQQAIRQTNEEQAMDDPGPWQLAMALTPRSKAALLRLALYAPGSSADLHSRAPSPVIQNAVLDALTRVSGSADTVIQLEPGAFVCLLRDAPSREALSLCSWALLDAVAALALNGKNCSPWRVAIGISMRLDSGASYATLLRSADAAMLRARRQRTGFAFFDERIDVWQLVSNEQNAPFV